MRQWSPIGRLFNYYYYFFDKSSQIHNRQRRARINLASKHAAMILNQVVEMVEIMSEMDVAT